jgi:fatty acid desaturase
MITAEQVPSPMRGALRNLKCEPISRLILGAYGFAEHGTHHVKPRLPYYHLSAAPNERMKDDPEMVPNHQYLEELAELARKYPLKPSGGESR